MNSRDAQPIIVLWDLIGAFMTWKMISSPLTFVHLKTASHPTIALQKKNQTATKCWYHYRSIVPIPIWLFPFFLSSHHLWMIAPDALPRCRPQLKKETKLQTIPAYTTQTKLGRGEHTRRTRKYLRISNLEGISPPGYSLRSSSCSLLPTTRKIGWRSIAGLRRNYSYRLKCRTISLEALTPRSTPKLQVF